MTKKKSQINIKNNSFQRILKTEQNMLKIQYIFTAFETRSIT